MVTKLDLLVIDILLMQETAYLIYKSRELIQWWVWKISIQHSLSKWNILVDWILGFFHKIAGFRLWVRWPFILCCKWPTCVADNDERLQICFVEPLQNHLFRLVHIVHFHKLVRLAFCCFNNVIGDKLDTAIADF